MEINKLGGGHRVNKRFLTTGINMSCICKYGPDIKTL